MENNNSPKEEKKVGYFSARKEYRTSVMIYIRSICDKTQKEVAELMCLELKKADDEGLFPINKFIVTNFENGKIKRHNDSYISCFLIALGYHKNFAFNLESLNPPKSWNNEKILKFAQNMKLYFSNKPIPTLDEDKNFTTDRLELRKYLEEALTS